MMNKKFISEFVTNPVILLTSLMVVSQFLFCLAVYVKIEWIGTKLILHPLYGLVTDVHPWFIFPYVLETVLPIFFHASVGIVAFLVIFVLYKKLKEKANKIK